MIHHSALSSRKLRFMKILDRHSVSVVVLREEIAKKHLLSRPELFGTFGHITFVLLCPSTTTQSVTIPIHHFHFEPQHLYNVLCHPPHFSVHSSIRVLLESSPAEVYMRFTAESSASLAIQWCMAQPQLFKDAKHGYQKYCTKFIHKQKCRKQSCSNRHSLVTIHRPPHSLKLE